MLNQSNRKNPLIKRESTTFIPSEEVLASSQPDKLSIEGTCSFFDCV